MVLITIVTGAYKPSHSMVLRIHGSPILRETLPKWEKSLRCHPVYPSAPSPARDPDGPGESFFGPGPGEPGWAWMGNERPTKTAGLFLPSKYPNDVFWWLWCLMMSYDGFNHPNNIQNISKTSFFFYILVGGAITILKNMSSSMGRMTSMKWKKMFETTNQYNIL